MNTVRTGTEPRNCLAAYLASVPIPGRKLTSADVEKGQEGKECLLQGGQASVSVLLDRLGDAEFYVKDACYDLILEIGGAARAALYEELGKRGPIADIWIVAMLNHLGDEKAMGRIVPHLRDPIEHVRHLTALALAFHFIETSTPPLAELWTVLEDALGDERTIEGTPFTVAGSALACLTRLSGESFIAPPREIQFYNYESFVYPPPVHPFPFAADFVTKADAAEKQEIRKRVRAWLAKHLQVSGSAGSDGKKKPR